MDWYIALTGTLRHEYEVLGTHTSELRASDMPFINGATINRGPDRSVGLV